MQRGFVDGAWHRAVRTLPDQTVVIEPTAQEPRPIRRTKRAATFGVGVLVVTCKLNLPVSDVAQRLEDLTESRGQISALRVSGDGITNRVENDAASRCRDELGVRGSRIRQGLKWEGGSRRHTRGCRKQLPAGQAESSAQFESIRCQIVMCRHGGLLPRDVS